MASDGTAASGLAVRYATALFDLATERDLLDQVASDLTRLKRLLADSPELCRFLRSPILSREQQSQGMTALLEKAEFSELTRQFVALVARKRRLSALGGMAEAFLADLARRQGKVSAEITVAQALTDAQAETVSGTIRRSLGDKVAISVAVDPELLGGMVVKIGSRLIDNSLKTKIDKLQLAMKAPGGQL